jgi:CRP-like cAMP-binding protein
LEEAVNDKAKLNQIIAAHPFLAGLEPQLCKWFCRCASLRCFDERQEVFREGGEADYFYLIESGQVVLDVFAPGRGRITIQTVEPGEALGWSWLFPPYQWHFSATATKPTEVIAFAAGSLRETAQQNQKFCYELVVRLARVLAGRLDDLRARLIYTCQELPGGE